MHFIWCHTNLNIAQHAHQNLCLRWRWWHPYAIIQGTCLQSCRSILPDLACDADVTTREELLFVTTSVLVSFCISTRSCCLVFVKFSQSWWRFRRFFPKHKQTMKLKHTRLCVGWNNSGLKIVYSDTLDTREDASWCFPVPAPLTAITPKYCYLVTHTSFISRFSASELHVITTRSRQTNDISISWSETATCVFIVK